MGFVKGGEAACGGGRGGERASSEMFHCLSMRDLILFADDGGGVGVWAGPNGTGAD